MIEMANVMAAVETVSQLTDLAFKPGDDERKRLQMGAVLLLAQSYLVEFAYHLGKCHDEDEALIATARGTMPISASKVDLLRAVGWDLKR